MSLEQTRIKSSLILQRRKRVKLLRDYVSHSIKTHKLLHVSANTGPTSGNT